MSVSRIGSVGALLGGVVWMVAAAVSWGSDALHRELYLAGLVLLVLSFFALGYSLVATAPLWLRGVVSIATPLLGLMVWLILRDSIPDDYVAAVVGGVVLFVGGGIWLGRSGRDSAGGPDKPEKPEKPRKPERPRKPEKPTHGRRAAR